MALLPAMWLLNRWNRGPGWSAFALVFGLVSVGSVAFHSLTYMSAIEWDWSSAYIPQRIGLSVFDGIGVSAPAALVLSMVSGAAWFLGRR